MPIHSINKEKVRLELRRIGWKVNEYGCWQRPTGMTDEEAENDWVQAILCGIGCQHEDTRMETIRLQEQERKRKHLIRVGDSSDDPSGQ